MILEYTSARLLLQPAASISRFFVYGLNNGGSGVWASVRLSLCPEGLLDIICSVALALIPPSHRRRGATAVLVRHKPQRHRHDRRGSAVVPSLIAVAPRTIVHLPVPKINSPGGADTASGEYTELRSVA